MPHDTTTMTDMWTYRDHESWTTKDVGGFSVEALDGDIGSVDGATYEAGSSHIVVDTGPWIFGEKVLLPAGTITKVDFDDRRVFVNRTKDQIRNAPKFDENALTDQTYRSTVGDYYGSGAGYRDW
jgi:hypothetical protein